MFIDFNDYILHFNRVTEMAALGAYKTIGKGKPMLSDGAAVQRARDILNTINIRGTIVIGEGERDRAPMLYVGEKVGVGSGNAVDIAIDPLECTTACAQGKGNSLSSLAFGSSGSILRMPDIYMEKLAVNVPVAHNEISLHNTTEQNITALARIKDCPVSELRVVILNRARHKNTIEAIYKLGARVILIEDGDIYGIISVALNENDMYIGIGGSPEGILAAAALRGMGGYMETKLVIGNREEEDRVRANGINDISKTYFIEDLIKDDAVFIATGVTDGDMLRGVREVGENTYHFNSMIITSSGTRTIDNTVTIYEEDKT